MWNIAVLTIMISLTGFYAMFDKESLAVAGKPKSMPIAENMALYREAVITYFTEHPEETGPSVDIATLVASRALPGWSSLANAPRSSIWANYRDTDGMIYIYAKSLPPVNIVADIVELAQNSVFAGVYRTGDTTLFSPVKGDTKIKFKLPANLQIPHGSPVWIAMRR
ncbi:hypothetical protein D3870_20955 [Noviherbaspirillum cavernae]|uniref:Pilus assembly protein PilM n=1 Tax=Noviherbaspirillum cavernae TaxID=2320862 RepID=A0A418WVX5_9BURK|nr:type IV pilus biogenesis protein PilM [Noviherbaspirillum cavernae]RJF96855.1 hypothetical protein D3870_20955 [Noviherbaspirillum cavernae]